MKAIKFLSLAAISFVSACGGGTTSATVNYTTLKAFSDGAGVGRGVASDGTETVFIAPDIAEVVAISNQDNPIDFQFSEFEIYDDTYPTAVIRQGTITVDGEVANITIVEDRGGEAGIIYMQLPGVPDAVFASGSAFGAAPTGSFTYNGFHAIQSRIEGDGEAGTFSLTADFNNRTFSYVGDTSSSTLTGGGTIDTVNGRFASNTIKLNALGVGDTAFATMYGQLHGDSAQSVSGVFHTNESDPFVSGAFVGSR